MNENTKIELAAMLTENTGRSMLDSGDAYGRHWQRNEGLTVADFDAMPRQTHSADYGTELNVYHYLAERLTFAPEVDAAWREFDNLRPELSWYESMDEWLDSLEVPAEGAGDYYSDARFSFNSYNVESLLSQTIQFTKFGLEGRIFVLLQIHGGADVRGGYTRPRVFEVHDDCFGLDTTDSTWSCVPCGFTAWFRNGNLEDYDLPESRATEGMLVQVDADTALPESWSIQSGCPLCHGALV